MPDQFVVNTIIVELMSKYKILSLKTKYTIPETSFFFSICFIYEEKEYIIINGGYPSNSNISKNTFILNIGKTIDNKILDINTKNNNTNKKYNKIYKITNPKKCRIIKQNPRFY